MKGKKSSNGYLCMILVSVLVFSLGYRFLQIKGIEGMEDSSSKDSSASTDPSIPDFTFGFGAGKQTTCPTYQKKNPDTGQCE